MTELMQEVYCLNQGMDIPVAFTMSETRTA